MVRKSIMLVAGETSGDMLAAELVRAVRAGLMRREPVFTTDFQPLHGSLEPHFFGAGGPHLREAGVHLDFDMTQHAVVGLWEVLKRYGQFRRLFQRLLDLARREEPDAIICVDFSGFNLRLAQAIRRHARAMNGTFGNWTPRIIQYVSPQVWASRPGRAQRLSRDSDLLLSIFPFEKEWYAQRAPRLRVEFVGHPLVDRYARVDCRADPSCQAGTSPGPQLSSNPTPNILLLPGSRTGELKQHLPVLLDTLREIRSAKPGLRATMVLPTENLAALARSFSPPAGVKIQIGQLAQALAEADLAFASTGTVTLECAFFRVPTVAFYMTSASTYWVAKHLVQVKYLAMPNLLAGEEVFPEFVQHAATPRNLARAGLDLLDNPDRRAAIQAKLGGVITSLGEPGATQRAAQAVIQLLESTPRALRAHLGRHRPG